MTVSWYIDEGLQKLKQEWLKVHPGATVYSVGDASHLVEGNASQHNPERSGSLPGQDAGEVDALDFMEGNGVTDADLDELWDGLLKGRDKRVLYIIRNRKIVSSVTQPWVVRPYTGSDPHTNHLHLSVNDLFDDNESDWNWEKAVARKIVYSDLTTKLPVDLRYGDETAGTGGWNSVGRAQALANFLDSKTPDIDADGVYGAKSVAKFKSLFGGDGKKLTQAQLQQLHGLS